jgi:hypothetical protein
MVIKETKVGLAETNSRTRGNSNAAPDVIGTDGKGLRTGDGVYAQSCLRHHRGCDHCRVLRFRAQPVASGRGWCAVGERQGRSRRCAAAGRRLLGAAVALYGSQLPARYAQPAGHGPRSALCVDGRARRATPARGQASGRRECGQAGGRLALAHTRICSLPWYSPSGGEKPPAEFFCVFGFAFYAPRAGSLRLQMERLHDRRPFLDVGNHQIGEILWRAALGHVAEPGQRLPGRLGAQA